MGGCASKPSAPNGPNHDIASPAAENPPPISEPIVADATAEVPISEPTVADATAEARDEVAEEIKEAPLVDLSEPTGEAPAVKADEEQLLHPGIIELKAEKAEEKAEVEKLVAAEEHPLQ